MTGFSSQIHRVDALSKLFRSRGIPVAVGGPGASTTPERYVGLADIIFIGEAEYVWPAFRREWQAGSYRKMYRQVVKPELSVSKPPRWELMGSLRNYIMIFDIPVRFVERLPHAVEIRLPIGHSRSPIALRLNGSRQSENHDGAKGHANRFLHNVLNLPNSS